MFKDLHMQGFFLLHFTQKHVMKTKGQWQTKLLNRDAWRAIVDIHRAKLFHLFAQHAKH